MKRREFITLLGGAAARGRSGAGAAAERMPVIGFLHGQSAESDVEGQRRIAAFRAGPQDMGYAEGRSVAIDISLGNGDIRPDCRHWQPNWSNAGVDVIAAPAAHPVAPP